MSKTLKRVNVKTYKRINVGTYERENVKRRQTKPLPAGRDT